MPKKLVRTRDVFSLIAIIVSDINMLIDWRIMEVPELIYDKNDPKRVLRDGERLLVPVALINSRSVTDITAKREVVRQVADRAGADAAHRDYVDAITNGWMDPVAAPQHQDAQQTADAADADETPYEAYCRRLAAGE